MRTLIAICALTLGAALCGCRTHKEETKVYPDNDPDTVVIEKQSQPKTIVVNHAHNASCGHYYYNGHWYAEPEHITIIEE
jgi:hypothetical protein